MRLRAFGDRLKQKYAVGNAVPDFKFRVLHGSNQEPPPVNIYTMSWRRSRTSIARCWRQWHGADFVRRVEAEVNDEPVPQKIHVHVSEQLPRRHAQEGTIHARVWHSELFVRPPCFLCRKRSGRHGPNDVKCAKLSLISEDGITVRYQEEIDGNSNHDEFDFVGAVDVVADNFEHGVFGPAQIEVAGWRV